MAQGYKKGNLLGMLKGLMGDGRIGEAICSEKRKKKKNNCSEHGYSRDTVLGGERVSLGVL